MDDTLEQVLLRARNWPETARLELEQVAREIDDQLKTGDYQPSAEELAAIDVGVGDADAGRLASVADVEAVFRRHRNT